MASLLMGIDRTAKQSSELQKLRKVVMDNRCTSW